MPVADEPPLHDFPDRALRQSLQHPQHLRAFLTQAVPELAPGFVCERARLLEREFPLDDWRRRESDLLFEVPYRSADEEHPALVCVLIEHQSAPDPRMPLRMLVYAVLYWERQWKAWEDAAAPGQEREQLLATAQSSQADAARQREVQTVGQTIAEWYIEQGRAEGQLKGQVTALQKTLLRLGRQRFGEPDAQTAAALAALTDLERLEKLTDRLLQVSSWQELLPGP